MPSLRAGDAARPALILFAMLGSVAFTSVLAWQALAAASSHRALAEEVLHDYAALGADEYVRRTASRVGYSGYFLLVNALGAWVEEHGSLPSKAELATGLEDRAATALGLADRLFWLPGSRDAGPGADPSPPPAWVRARAPEVSELGAGLTVLHHRDAAESETAVAARLAGSDGSLIGFTVDRAVLGDWFRASFEGGPLLPTSLVGDLPPGDWVQVRVLGADGSEVFRSAARGEYSF